MGVVILDRSRAPSVPHRLTRPLTKSACLASLSGISLSQVPQTPPCRCNKITQHRIMLAKRHLRMAAISKSSAARTRAVSLPTDANLETTRSASVTMGELNSWDKALAMAKKSLWLPFRSIYHLAVNSIEWKTVQAHLTKQPVPYSSKTGVIITSNNYCPVRRTPSRGKASTLSN